MPRVKTLKFNIRGNDYISHVNFSAKTSLFSVSLHWQVTESIGFEYQGKKFTATNLPDIVNPIMEAYDAYLNAQMKHELFISIKYKCNGAFMRDSEGNSLFDWMDSEFFVRNSFTDQYYSIWF